MAIDKSFYDSLNILSTLLLLMLLCSFGRWVKAICKFYINLLWKSSLLDKVSCRIIERWAALNSKLGINSSVKYFRILWC